MWHQLVSYFCTLQNSQNNYHRVLVPCSCILCQPTWTMNLRKGCVHETAIPCTWILSLMAIPMTPNMISLSPWPQIWYCYRQDPKHDIAIPMTPNIISLSPWPQTSDNTARPTYYCKDKVSEINICAHKKYFYEVNRQNIFLQTTE